jgi:Ni,Fe-hydrogenase III large subunit
VSALLSGARDARPSWLRRLVARAAARDLHAFVVPGPGVARALGLDLGAAGLVVSGTPRHAGVLLLVGEVPEKLREAAAVAYAQMPRPRAVLAVGTEEVSPLPGPDVSVPLGQESLAGGVAVLRRAFAEGAFAPEAPDFDAVGTETRYVCPMHPEVVRDEPGTCPICGMDLVPRESAGGMNHENMDHAGHEGMDHGHMGHGSDGEEMDHGESPGGHGMDHSDDAGRAEAQNQGSSGEQDHAGHGSMSHGESDDADEDHGNMNHEAMDHGDMSGMDHGDMGFMSMVEMTKDLPRSSDGLPMEWVEAPFGPLFPGLPAGLALTLTLDGDTVAEAEAGSAVAGRATQEAVGPGMFVDRMARLDPLAPVSYRLLALRAIEDAANVALDERAALSRMGALEKERAASHLGWFASFGCLLGDTWLEERAARLQLSLLQAGSAEEAARYAPEVEKLARRLDRTPLLRRRLAGIGRLPGGAEAAGPVARAGGSAEDLRTEEGVYADAGFEPVVREGGDALSRLRLRLEEAQRSLDLLRRAGSVRIPEPVLDADLSGEGVAAVETPRGAARLHVKLDGGRVEGFELRTPSTGHLELVLALVEQRELGDALVGVASLDLSPWEVVG